jgi:hypothetical protein
MDAANQSAILNALSFDQMNERFFQVPEAAENTFTWIFQESDTQMESNHKLKYPFKKWLASGSGIFHISGKPGSGKSTLMKYLFKHPETTSQLQTWAGEKELVATQSFFWKPGSPLQKNLVGLVRSLLFSVLKQCPEATPEVFPCHWKPFEYHPWAHSKKIQLGDDEILAAFDSIVGSEDSNIYSGHRFCFFVDGLDEFEESCHHKDLVLRLNQWITASGGSIKICVSSRELPVFQDRLDVRQRIRLQDLTRQDIEAFVREKLETEEHFQSIRRYEKERCNRFEDQIVEKADGVFLWVTLVLNLVSEGLECRESLLDLERKLDILPQKLEEFIGYMLTSISEGQKRKAFCTLSYAMTAARCSSSMRCFNTKSYLLSPLSLFRFSFLDEYIDDRNLSKVSEYRDMHKEKIKERVAAAAAQVTGRCKGLLELRENEYRKSGSTIRFNRNTKLVVFTHRSIPEYLASFLQTKEPSYYLKEFDPIDALIKTLIAVLNALPLERKRIPDSIGRNLYFVMHEIRESVALEKTPYFETLEILDALCHQRQLEVHTDFDKVRWSHYFPVGLLYTGEPDDPDIGEINFYDICHVSISLSFNEYTSWKFLRSPKLLDDGPWLVMSAVVLWLLDWVSSGFHDLADITAPERALESLRQLLPHLGVNMILRPTGKKPLRNKSVWTLILQEMMWCYHSKALFWGILEVFLEFGADIPFWKRIGEKDVLLDVSNREWAIIYDWGKISPPIQDWPSDWVTLQYFVDYYNPLNSAAITRLLNERTKRCRN